MERPYAGITIHNYADWVEAGWTAKPQDLAIMTLGLVGEAGEVSEPIKKHIRGDGPVNTDNLKLEIGDVLHYLVRIARYFEIDLEDVMISNIEKIEARRGKRAFEKKVA